MAAGIDVPGSHGGSTHTWEVAQGLHELGHEITVVAHSPRSRAGGAQPRRSATSGVRLLYLDLPKPLSLLGYPLILRLARRLAPDAIIERYYNLSGAGILAAHRCGLPSLLEVNALIVDPPAVRKRRVDDRLGRPLRRWATWQCRAATRIVTPLATTVPETICRDKIVELPWGANVDAFSPRRDAPVLARLRRRLNLPAELPVVVFAGSFRVWHGVHDFVAAALRLLDAGAPYHFLLIGDGPERAAAMEAAARHAERFDFVGSIPHAEMPDYLAQAQAGVAPFNTRGHPALRSAGFFWSPLKIYEYMAMGLPVITPAIPPLDTTIREGIEGALYPEGDVEALAAAIRRVLESTRRQDMGDSARERVVRDFSWDRHCRELDTILAEIRQVTVRSPHG